MLKRLDFTIDMTKFGKLLIMTALVAVFASCNTQKKIAYFQDVKDGEIALNVAEREIVAQPADRLSIIVTCREPQLARLYNLMTPEYQVSVNGAFSNGSRMSYYTIDPEGNIQFPVVGKIHVAGLTRVKIADEVKRVLQEKENISDATVSVEFANVSVSVLGEVARPGRYPIDRDHYTIVDAISQAGDLSIYGRRENVLVLRNENGVRTTYHVDLTSANAMLNSPVYYLRQGDMVYVEPNAMRARQSTVNGNNVLSTSFWISLASLLTSMAVLIFK